MIKAFLVEDETVIREGLRDKIPWGQYGYELVGEAADGEMALPLIRKYKPDVLITDIKMPFMDGLSLSKIVHEEAPDTKIIIMSGYDDFEYARQAIEVGVMQYLLKPITKSKLTSVLAEVREKIEENQEKQDYQALYESEIHEYEQFSRRRFFEKVLKGEWSVSEIYEEAHKLDIEISAPSYNMLILYLQEKVENSLSGNEANFAQLEDEVLHYFIRTPQYLLFRLNVNSYGIIVKSEDDKIEALTNSGVQHIKEVCEKNTGLINWYVAVGTPVSRLSMLSSCYQEASRFYSYRFLVPMSHILTEENLKEFEEGHTENSIGAVEPSTMDPEIIKEFLNKGNRNEIDNFVETYMQNIRDALESRMFKDYVILNIRFTTIAFAESLGVKQDEFLKEMTMDAMYGSEDVSGYLAEALKTAIDIRDKQSDDQQSRIIRQALEYIDENYTDEAISLNQVASKVNVSANYFSAIFSQNMQMTFVEYVTNKRMEKAKKLLRTTDILASEVALMVGYKDAHYFSFVFKKTQGTSPREYRAGKRT